MTTNPRPSAGREPGPVVGPVHAALDAAVRGIAGLTSLDAALQVIVGG